MKISKTFISFMSMFLAFTLLISYQFACKENTVTPEIAPKAKMQKEILSPYNQGLLDKFLVDSKKYFKSSEVSLRTANYTLAFVNEDAFNLYNTGLDALSSAWDASNGQPVPAGDDFALMLNPGNPAFNAVDYSLAFESCRYDYAYLAQERLRSISQSDEYVGDPYLQRVMNLDEEVIIGDYLVKQLEGGISAKIPLWDGNSINLVRQYGIAAPVYGVEFTNDETGDVINQGVELRGAVCDVSLKAVKIPNSTNVTAIVNAAILDGARISICIGVDAIINFGDGTGDFTITNDRLTHTYSVPANTARPFKIKVRIAPVVGCSECLGKTNEIEVLVSNFPSCHEGENGEKKKNIDFQGTSGGQTFPCTITSTFGFRGKKATFKKPKIWLGTDLQIFKNNKWNSARPAVPIVISTSRSLKTNSCTTDAAANFTMSTTSSSAEMLKTPGDVPSIFGVNQIDRNVSLWGKIQFGGVVFERPFWEWDN